MFTKGFNRAIRVCLFFTYFILFATIAVIVLMSFNKTPFGMLPFVFTAQWYELLFSGGALIESALLSLELSGAVALSAMLLGTLAALGVQYLRPRPAALFMSAANAPIIIPWLVQAIALLLIFNLTGLGRSYIGLYLGNLIVVLPYCVMMAAARFSEADRTPEDAARMLGAGRVRVFLDVTLPMLLPGVLSGGLMAFMVCFNAFAMQYFLAPFGVNTLPMEIFTMIRSGYKPDMNALSSLMIAVTLLIVLLLNRLGVTAAKMMRSKNL
jgi:spermidine/putrescine transport system permease protein